MYVYTVDHLSERNARSVLDQSIDILTRYASKILNRMKRKPVRDEHTTLNIVSGVHNNVYCRTSLRNDYGRKASTKSSSKFVQAPNMVSLFTIVVILW